MRGLEITVSVEMRIVNHFVSLVNLSVSTLTLGIVHFFRARRSLPAKSECVRTPMSIQQKMLGSCSVFSSLALLLQTITSKIVQIKLMLAFLSKLLAAFI